MIIDLVDDAEEAACVFSDQENAAEFELTAARLRLWTLSDGSLMVQGYGPGPAGFLRIRHDAE